MVHETPSEIWRKMRKAGGGVPAPASLRTSQAPGPERKLSADAGGLNSEQLLETVLAGAPLVLWQVDRQGLFTMSLGRGLETLGLKPGAVVGRSVFEVYAGVPEIVESVRSALCGEEIQATVEVAGLFFESTFLPVRDEAGAVTGAVGVATAVTERERAEQASRESRRRYDMLARLAPVGIFETDGRDGCRYVNDYWLALTGLSADEARQQGWTAAVHSEDRSRVSRVWRETVQAGRPFRDEVRLQRPDGSTLWVLLRAEPEPGPQGDATVYVGAATNITPCKEAEAFLQRRTVDLESCVQQRLEQARREHAVLLEQIHERRRMAEALRESEDKWLSLVQQAPDYILTVTPDGTIQFINRTDPDAMGDEVVGSSVYRYLPDEYRDQVRQVLAAVFEQGESVSHEVRAITRDGRQAWYRARVGPVRRGDRVVSAIIVASDITHQKQAEEEERLRQAELAHLARVVTIGEMTTILSHELKTPLAAIANFAAGCVRRLRSGQIDTENLLDALDEIAGQAVRASDTIGRIRSFLQKRTVEHDVADLNRLVDDAVALVIPEAQRQGVRVVQERTQVLPPVLADGLQVQQVLVNLLLNGMEAMEQTPPDERVLLVRTSAENHQVTVSVTDAGCGLPEGFEDRIFESFETTKPQGLGIGLSISRSIIEAHGGRLEAAPNAGRGATFYFNLPIWAGGDR